jgi:hypothetical protein
MYQPNPEVPIWFHTINAMTETFEIYRNWLYTEKSKLFCHDAEGDQDFADDGSGPAHEGREWIRLALAYLLGLKFGDEGFCNVVIDGLVEKMGESVSYVRSSHHANPRSTADRSTLPATLPDRPRQRSVLPHRPRR